MLRNIKKEELLSQLLRFKKLLGISRYSSIGEFIDLRVKICNCVRPSVKNGQVSSTQGIGKNIKSALSGAILEAIERYCASNYNKDRLRMVSYEESEKNAEFLPVSGLGYNLKGNKKICWIQGTDVLTSESIYVPAREIVFPFCEADDVEGIRSSTSGLACGSCLQEAKIFSVLEVIERHYVSRFYRNFHKKQVGCNIRLKSLPDGDVKAQVIELVDRGYDVSIFRISAILPVYFVTLMDSSNIGPKFMVGGTSCHIFECEALEGALLEAIQGLVVALQGVREDLARHKEKYSNNIFDGEKQFLKFLLTLKENNKTVDYFDEGLLLDSNDQGHIFNMIIKKMMTVGIDKIVVVDLSQEQFPFSVVKAFAPGMFDLVVNPEREPFAISQ